MAPQQNPNDPSIIDINLSLLGANSQDALQALVAQLSEVNEHLAQFAERDYEGQIRAARGRAGRSGVEDKGRPSSRASIGGQQERGIGPTYGVHDSTSTPPTLAPSGLDEFGDMLNRQRERDARAGQPPMQPLQSDLDRDRRSIPPPPPSAGWRLRGDGDTPDDRNIREQLRVAWEESANAPERGRPGYGRMGLMLDSIMRQRSAPPTSPNMDGQPSPSASVNGLGGGEVGGADPYGSLGPIAPNRDPSDPLYNVRPEGIRQPITMPQHYGGTWTGQDYLSMASNMFARSYLHRVDRGEPSADDPNATAGQVWRARAANTLGSAANSYAQFHALYQGGRRLVSHLTGPEGPLGYSIRPGDVERTGEALGYERGQDYLGSSDFGFRKPWDKLTSPAAMEGWRDRRLRTALAAQPNINREQAGQMVDVLEGMGWSGRERDTMAFTTMAPLMQQGQNPEVIGPMLDRSIRYGSGSLQQFNEAMSHVGTAARESRMTLDEYTQSMGDFATIASEQGSPYVQGLQSARRFTGATGGMDPRFGGELMQNPLIQSVGMMQTGLLPAQQGLLGGQETANMALQTTDLMMKMTQGFHRATRVPIDPNNPNGPKRTIDPLDAQYAQAASMMGISVDRFRQLRRQRNRIQAGTAAENALQQFGRDVHQVGAHGSRHTNIFGHDVTLPGTGATHGLETHGLHGGPSWDYVEKELRRAGVSRNEVDRIGRMDIQKRTNAAQTALENAGNRNDRNIHGQSQNTVITLSKTASKFFDLVQNKNGSRDAANAGDSLRANDFASPRGPGLSDFSFLIGANK